MIAVLGAVSFTAQADVMQMPTDAAAAAPAPAAQPQKGDSMATVTKNFGEPSMKHPAAGGDTRKHPPITRWDYAGFSVFFERKKVVDVVVPAMPPPVSHVEELKPATPAPN